MVKINVIKKNIMVQSIIIIIVSITITAVLAEFVWIKLRKQGHKDLWEVLKSKFSHGKNN